MAVSNASSRVVTTGDGSTTSFSISPIVLFDKAHLQVTVDGVLKTFGTDYTIELTAPDDLPSTGSVVFTVAPATGKKVIFLRDMPIVQTLVLPLNGPFNPASLERALDKLTYIIGDVKTGGAEFDILEELPDSTGHINHFLKVTNANGDIDWAAIDWSDVSGKPTFAEVATSGEGVDVAINSSGFNGNLGTNVNTVQKLAQAFNDAVLRASESSEEEAKTGTGDGDDRMSARRTKDAIDEQAAPDRIARKPFYAAYADDASATPSTVPAGSFLALTGSSNKIGNNTEFSETNFKFLVVNDQPSFYEGITDTNDTQFVNQFIQALPSIREKLDDIEVGGFLHITNAIYQNVSEATFTKSIVAKVTSIGTVGGRKKIGIEVLSISGTGNLTQGDDLQVWFIPSAPDFETVLASLRSLDEWPHAVFSAAAAAQDVAAGSTADFIGIDSGHNIVRWAWVTFLQTVKDNVLPEPEHETVTGLRWRGLAADPEQLAANKDAKQPNANQLWFRLTAAADRTKLERYAKKDHTFEIWKDADNYRRYVLSEDAFTESGSNNDWYVNIVGTATVVVGTIAVDDAIDLRLTGPFVTQDRVRRDVRADGTATDIDIPTEKAVRDAIDDAVVPKEDTVPFAAAFREHHAVTWAATIDGSAHSQAAISDGNNKPSGTPDGTTTSIDMTYAEGVEPTAAVGDWIRAEEGSNYIIAEVQHIDTATNGTYPVYKYWVDVDEADAHTLAYEQIGTGAGEVRFYTRASGSGGGGGGDIELSNMPEIASDYIYVGQGTSADPVAKPLVDKTITTPNTAYDSGDLLESASESVTDTDSIPFDNSVAESGLLSVEDISGFGEVMYFEKAFNGYVYFQVTANQGVAIHIRASTVKPTSSSDAKSYGNSQVNVGGQNNITVRWPASGNVDIAAGTYVFFALSGGGSRNCTARTVRVAGTYTKVDEIDGLIGNTAAAKATIRAAIAGEKLTKDVAGAADITLTDLEGTYRSMRFTGALTGNIVVTLPALSAGLLALDNGTTGSYTLKVKAEGQDDSAAVTLPAGVSSARHTGTVLTLLSEGGGGATLKSLPTTGTHRTAAHTFVAGDVDKWNSFLANNSSFDLTLNGDIGSVDDRFIIALRSQGNPTVNAKRANGTLKVYSSLGIATLTDASTQQLIGSGGNRQVIWTAIKTGATEWSIYEGVWWDAT